MAARLNETAIDPLERTSEHRPLRPLRAGRGRFCAVARLLVAALLTLAAPTSPAAATPVGRLVVLQAYGSGAILAIGPRSLYRLDARAVAIAPLSLPPSVAAITGVAANRFGRIYVADSRSRVWTSEDDGGSWAARGDGLPDAPITSLAAHAADAETVYAVVAGDGIYRSEDGGRSWSIADGGPSGMTGPLVHSDMPGSMETGWLFAATTDGVNRSMDCFCLWRRAGGLGGDVQALTFDPSEPSHLYAATDDALYRSVDGGGDWEPVTAPAEGVRSLAVTTSGVLYAVSADGAVDSSTDRARSWQRIDRF